MNESRNEVRVGILRIIALPCPVLTLSEVTMIASIKVEFYEHLLGDCIVTCEVPYMSSRVRQTQV